MQEISSSNEFDAIRPYDDSEVLEVLDRVINDEEFIDAIMALKFDNTPHAIKWFVRYWLKRYIKRKFSKVRSIWDFQMLVRPFVERMIQNTTGGYTVSGTENLDPEKNYLFISNHRDIALDPALLNYALVQYGMGTLRIAIGNNLLTKPFASDLMRLNKSFIVNRSATAPRQILKATKQLSAYIKHSIVNDKSNVWIAQREGRAKDGCDVTEPAIIKMLSLSKASKDEPLGQSLQNLHIVPVAISYEYDPCDAAKAKELYIKADQGIYEKSEQEDVKSIGAGISGEKGRVHIAIGSELVGDFQSADDVANVIDSQVMSLYRLHPTNFFAYQSYYGENEAVNRMAEERGWLMPAMSVQKALFDSRVNDLEEECRPYMLKMYAECLKRKLESGLIS